MSETMPLPYDAKDSQFFAKMMNVKKERFVKLCLKWDSASDLADDLYSIGYKASERTCSNWRSRSFKKVPYNAVQAVKLAAEIKSLNQAKAWAQSLTDAEAL